jgi:biotin carboxyl carrier protein
VGAARVQLKKRGLPEGDESVLTYLMFPTLAMELFHRQAQPPPASEEAESPAGAPAAEPETVPVEAPPIDLPVPAPPVQTAEFEVEVEGEVFKVRVTGAGTTVAPAAPDSAAEQEPKAASAPAPMRDGAVVAPMQGLIVRVPVSVGDEVALGDVLAVLEAMKMQNDIIAVKPGKVVEVYVKEGEVVSPNQPLVAVS